MTPLLWLLLAGVILLLAGVLASYNRFVRERTLVDESWGGIDVELSRRHDLIPNLVETVRGYAAHERETLELLVRARETATAHRDEPPHDRQPYEEGVTRALQSVLGRVEAYPDLKASSSFLALQRELTLTEDRIAAARRFYNGNVRAYNTRVRTFPSNLVASTFGFDARDFFELEDPASATASVPRVGPAG
jgi:LemA protein